MRAIRFDRILGMHLCIAGASSRNRHCILVFRAGLLLKLCAEHIVVAEVDAAGVVFQEWEVLEEVAGAEAVTGAVC